MRILFNTTSFNVNNNHISSNYNTNFKMDTIRKLPRKALEDCIEQGLSAPKIAKKFGLNVFHVVINLKYYGLKTKPRQAYNELKNKIEEYLQNGLSTTEIGKLCGLDRRSVYEVAIKALGKEGFAKYNKHVNLGNDTKKNKISEWNFFKRQKKPECVNSKTKEVTLRILQKLNPDFISQYRENKSLSAVENLEQSSKNKKDVFDSERVFELKNKLKELTSEGKSNKKIEEMLGLNLKKIAKIIGDDLLHQIIQERDKILARIIYRRMVAGLSDNIIAKSLGLSKIEFDNIVNKYKANIDEFLD